MQPRLALEEGKGQEAQHNNSHEDEKNSGRDSERVAIVEEYIAHEAGTEAQGDEDGAQTENKSEAMPSDLAAHAAPTRFG